MNIHSAILKRILLLLLNLLLNLLLFQLLFLLDVWMTVNRCRTWVPGFDELVLTLELSLLETSKIGAILLFIDGIQITDFVCNEMEVIVGVCGVWENILIVELLTAVVVGRQQVCVIVGVHILMLVKLTLLALMPGICGSRLMTVEIWLIFELQ